MAEEYRPARLRQRKNAALPENRWQPTQWKPEYESVIALHAGGKTNKEIAVITGFHEVHISNILNCEQALAIKANYVKVIREDTEVNLKVIETKAMKRINEILDNDEIAQAHPLALFDRSLAFLKGTAKLIPDGSSLTQNNTQNVNVFSDAMGEKILAGLVKSDEAKKLNAGVTGDSIN